MQQDHFTHLTALTNQCLTVILEYIDLSWQAWYSQLLVGPTQSFGYAPKMRYSTNPQVYLHDHTCQLEYSKQYRFGFQRIQWLKTNISSYSTLSIFVLCLVLYWTRSPIRQSSMLSGLNARMNRMSHQHASSASMQLHASLSHWYSTSVLRASNLCIFSTSAKINSWTTSIAG